VFLKSGKDFIAESFVPETLSESDGDDTVFLSSSDRTYAFSKPKPECQQVGVLQM
jgi:hypothetical protein